MSLRIHEGPSGGRRGFTRRSFLRRGLITTGGLAATAAALAPLRDLEDDDLPSVQKFLQKHYKEMSPDEMASALAELGYVDGVEDARED